MHIIRQAFDELYPDRELDRDVNIKYSGKFKPYNANIRYSHNRLQVNLSREWKEVSREIKIGLIQSLLVKIFKGKPNTGYRDLYDSFIKNLSRYAPKTRSDPFLEESFQRVNNRYFFGMLDKPNLVWGSNSLSKLGSYEYQSDTINISKIFQRSDPDLLDYIMYHEMLHKKHRYYTKSGRNYHHTTKFRSEEKKFENQEEIERKLKSFCRISRYSHKTEPLSLFKRIFFPK